jgi:hypothetical protein
MILKWTAELRATLRPREFVVLFCFYFHFSFLVLV